MAGDPNDFSEKTKRTLAEQANYECSNPDCPNRTSGPNSDATSSIRTGEAAHIRGAHREANNRFDPSMTPEERSDIRNGIHLCVGCAREIDTDERKYTVELLLRWKKQHLDAIAAGRRREEAAKEINVSDGGVGGVIFNSGSGTGEEVSSEGPGPAQRTTVTGQGIGEIVVNTGPGLGKRITGSGPIGGMSHAIVTGSVREAYGFRGVAIATSCPACRASFVAQITVQAFVGNEQPRVQIPCPQCGHRWWHQL